MSLYSEIKKNFIIENASKDWEQYRSTLTDYLIKLSSQKEEDFSLDGVNFDHIQIEEYDQELPTLAIVGAGYCNDLDLNRLIPYFSNITLLDYDEDAVNIALERENLSELKQLQVKGISLTGIDEVCFEDFAESLRFFVRESEKELSLDAMCQFSTSFVRKQFESEYKLLSLAEFGTYDYVWCFGLHSQLLGMYGYIYKLFVETLSEDEKFHFEENGDQRNDRFFDELRRYNESIIPEVNDLLIGSAKQCCIIGNEWDKLDDTDSYYEIKDVPVHGIEGAYQAIMDIRLKNDSLKEGLLLWPFSVKDSVFYQMMIQTIKKE